MASASLTATKFMALLVAAGALGLGACSKQPTEYKTDVVDESGGKLIVEEPSPNAVDVNEPETPMTNVPPSEAASDGATAEDAPAQ